MKPIEKKLESRTVRDMRNDQVLNADALAKRLKAMRARCLDSWALVLTWLDRAIRLRPPAA
jgi:hypothetical protein